MSATIYKPPPSLVEFLTCEQFVSLVTGPVGSGKSSAAMLKIAYHAKQMRAGKDGIRRSRAAVIRNTVAMLNDATIPTFYTWFPDGIAGHMMKTEKRFMLKFDDVECEILFRGLDDANDVRRLLSLELSFGVLDEFREIHPDIFSALQGRVGRYPSKKDGGCVKDDGSNNHHVWGASNAPDYATFWEEFLNDPPKTAKAFLQPSALSPEADWIDHLIDGYYTTLAEGKSEDWVDVYIHNKFGRSLSGQPVFRAFNRDTHVSKSPPNILPGVPIIIGVDAGLSPAAVIGQVDYTGRVIVHDALISDSMGALRFCRERLKPLIASKYVKHNKPMVIIDPAAFQRAQTDERTVADIFRTEGFTVKPARTNAIAARIAAVDKYLTRTVDGKAGFLLSPAAQPLVVALSGKYRYKISTKGEVDEKPDKNHPWSDVADALQYLCLHADGGSLFGTEPTVAKRDVKKAPAMGWT